MFMILIGIVELNTVTAILLQYRFNLNMYMLYCVVIIHYTITSCVDNVFMLFPEYNSNLTCKIHVDIKPTI